MFPSAEYVLSGEHAYRRSQVSADYAAAGGRRGVRVSRRRRRRELPTSPRLKGARTASAQ